MSFELMGFALSFETICNSSLHACSTKQTDYEFMISEVMRVSLRNSHPANCKSAQNDDDNDEMTVCTLIAERNGLMFVVRSHSEIPEGCGRSHEGCYTVFSAPNPAKNILGGIMVIRKHLEKEGIVFKTCTEPEIASFQESTEGVCFPE